MITNKFFYPITLAKMVFQSIIYNPCLAILSKNIVKVLPEFALSHYLRYYFRLTIKIVTYYTIILT